MRRLLMRSIAISGNRPWEEGLEEDVEEEEEEVFLVVSADAVVHPPVPQFSAPVQRQVTGWHRSERSSGSGVAGASARVDAGAGGRQWSAVTHGQWWSIFWTQRLQVLQ